MDELTGDGELMEARQREKLWGLRKAREDEMEEDCRRAEKWKGWWGAETGLDGGREHEGGLKEVWEEKGCINKN